MKAMQKVAVLIAILLIGGTYGLAQDDPLPLQQKIEELISKLGTREGDMAIDALVEIGEPAVDPAIRALNDLNARSWLIPARANYVLVRIGTQKAVKAVIDALNNQRLSHNVREYSARSLGQVRSEEVMESLIIALKDENPWVRGNAAGALGKLEFDKAADALLKALEDEDSYVRGASVSALSKIRPTAAIESFVAMLKDENWRVRRSARNALQEIGMSAFEPLIKALKHEDRNTRWQAAWLLGKIGSAEAVEALVEALRDQNWMVRNEAALALRRIASDRAVPLLVEALEDEAAYTREEAIWILGELKARGAIDPLIRVLSDGQIGWTAALALGKIEADRAVRPLITVLKDENSRFRQAAAWALGEIKSGTSVIPLVDTLRDSDFEVRNYAAEALRKIGTPAALEAVKEWEKQRESSEKTYRNRISLNKDSYPLYPETLDTPPDIPSPCFTDDGTEILVAITKEQKYTLIPVTVENGETLDYKQRLWGKGRQLDVDAEDFPALARTGLHSEMELDRARTITGRSVSEITELGRPGRSSEAGFMGADEDIISVLKGDNRLVKMMDLTHPHMARPLFHIWNIILIDYQLNRLGRYWENIEWLLYNGCRVSTKAEGSRGWQESLFKDEILGMYQIELWRELSQDEKTFLKEKYSHLSDEQMAVLQKKLSYFHTGEMAPYYIMRYGFYEGHTDYRADPIAIAFIFGLRSLEEIERVFQGELYRVLTDHFTR